MGIRAAAVFLGAFAVPLAGAAAAGLLVARAATAPARGRRFRTRVRGVLTADGVSDGGHAAVLLEATPDTLRPGRFGAVLPDGRFVRFGWEARPWGKLVMRHVSARDAGALRRFRCISWSAMAFPDSRAAGLTAHDELIPSELGPIPAWRVPAGERGQDGAGAGAGVEAATGVDADASADAVWVVHVHGAGGVRAGTLRGVRVAARLGLPSLVVTFRNAFEAPRCGTGRGTLGLRESRDVASALDWAAQLGVRDVILFGWSMGAGIALRLAHDSRYRGFVRGVIAESPVLDWRAALAAGCRGAGLPGWCGRLAEPWLASGLLGARIRLDELDWTRPGCLRVPLLILQGTEDRTTPWQIARDLAQRDADAGLTLFEADHTGCWNADPERWEREVSGWLRRLPARPSR